MKFRWFGALALLLVPCASPAQVVRGQVVSARDSSAMASVVVQLLDASGVVVGRTMSDERGQFRLVAPRPGTHRIRTMRIGFRPATSEPLRLESGVDIAPRIALTPVPLALEAVNVSARNACRVYADAGSAAELWDQARTAFTATQLSSAERGVAVTTTAYHRELEPGTEAVITQRVDAQSGFTSRPWVSLSADSLRRSGYVVPTRDGWTIYYAPDLDVLASDVFLADHCLRIASEDSSQVAIAFEPTRDRSRIPEIAGTVWLDRRTYELRRMEFRYVNVSSAHRDVAAGGFMEFLRVGRLWAVSGWHIRMPVIQRYAELGRSPEERVTRLRVSGGDLVLVRRGADTLWARPALNLLATVVDSASGQPLPGTRVEVRGTTIEAFTDSAGRVTVRGLLPGVYSIRIASQDMQALGATHEERIALTRQGEQHRLRLPTLSYTLDRLCPGLKPRDGLIVGRAVARGDSAGAANLKVFARWDLLTVREVSGGVVTSRDPRFTETTTRADGTYTLCGVPTITRATLLTEWNERGPGVELMITGDRRVMRQDLVVDPPRGSYRGTVVDVTASAPVENVEVVLPFADLETRTAADGSFLLRDVPAGSHDIVFRRIGFMPVTVRRGFSRDSVVTERIVMARAVVLDSVIVREKSSGIPGFDNRRIFHQGHAITRDELERQQNRRMSEILATVPGLRLQGVGVGAAWAFMGRGANTINTLRNPDRTSALRGAKPACYSDIYLDGALIYGGAMGGAEPPPLVDLNSFNAVTLDAIEYFAGPAQTPPEYNKTGSSCGVLLLWSRRPGSR